MAETPTLNVRVRPAYRGRPMLIVYVTDADTGKLVGTHRACLTEAEYDELRREQEEQRG